LEAYGQVGSYFEEGDGETQDYAASYGWSGNNDQLVLGANWTKQELVSSADRSLSAFPAPYATDCTAGGGSAGPVNGRYDIFVPSLGANSAIDVTQGRPGVTPILFNPASCAPSDPGASSCALSPTNSFRDFTTADKFNFAPYNYLLTPSERLGAFA